jgi:molecular chaperone DnaK
MGTAIYAQSQAASAPEGDAGESEGESQDDDVVEAEIVDDDKPADQEGGAA